MCASALGSAAGSGAAGQDARGRAGMFKLRLISAATVTWALDGMSIALSGVAAARVAKSAAQPRREDQPQVSPCACFLASVLA